MFPTTPAYLNGVMCNVALHSSYRLQTPLPSTTTPGPEAHWVCIRAVVRRQPIGFWRVGGLAVGYEDGRGSGERWGDDGLTVTLTVT